MRSTKNLKDEHITIRRVKDIAIKCSDNLYSNKPVPIADIEIISVIIEEFVDNFHHGKEEKAYFPETKEKDDEYAESIRKFLIEHELGRRIAIMLRRELKKCKEIMTRNKSSEDNNIINRVVDSEPIARFLKSYAVYIDDHTTKEDKFFDMVDTNQSISIEDDKMLLKHYESCKSQAGGEVRIQEMLRLIDYIETREWMRY